MSVETLPGVAESEQLELAIAEMVEPEPLPQEATDRDRYEAFHAANPWVLGVLEKAATELIRSGRTRFGIEELTNVVRWENRRAATSTDGFRFNNNHRPYYARALKARHPEWGSAIETRKMKDK